MAYIYKITNIVNNKKYIGKTERDLDTRWQEHIRKAKKYPHIPLYAAINKYGKEQFTIEMIEQCSSEELDEREMYWINFYNTYHSHDYNCTGGGEGGIKPIPEEELNEIAYRYQNGERLDYLAKEYHHGYLQVREALQQRKNIVVNTQAGPMTHAKSIASLDPKTNEIIKIYSSISEASRDLCKEGKNPRVVYNHIQKVIGQPNVRYGYRWIYYN